MRKLLITLNILIFGSLINTYSVQGQDGSQQDIKLANEYYSQGQSEKALLLYEKISRDLTKISLIHNNYFYLLLQNQMYKDAEKYIERLIKKYPTNIFYRLDLGRVYYSSGDVEKADNYYRAFIKEVSQNTYIVGNSANYFANNQLIEYSFEIYLSSRKVLGNPSLYALELANLYRIQNNKDKMVAEYLNYMSRHPGSIDYIKNTFQRLLTETEDLEALEALLYQKIQDEPGNTLYPDLLKWTYIQLKNFYGAFLQARALDLRKQTDGDYSFEVGNIALNNENFETAEKIFQWIIENYKGTSNYIAARIRLIEAYEMRVKNTYPISKSEIREIINSYDALIREVGTEYNALRARKNQALLYGFYLDEKDTAIYILQQLIKIPGMNGQLKANCKLDLGDIYLLNNESWESTLLYSQVEKEMNDSPLAYEAKLKNAKLNYYQGNFLLAQEHLDILKKATTREIANDAMSLSLLIKDNIQMDSTEKALRKYAEIDLLLFQNKDSMALNEINRLKEELDEHPLNDELLFLEAKVKLENGDFEGSSKSLIKLMENHGDDILGDDAYFMLAELYDKHLEQKERALEVYFDFLSKYPGSVYSVEVRKRFRSLRGDFDQLDL